MTKTEMATEMAIAKFDFFIWQCIPYLYNRKTKERKRGLTEKDIQHCIKYGKVNFERKYLERIYKLFKNEITEKEFYS